MSCNNRNCKLEKDKLIKQKKSGWCKYFNLRQEFINFILEQNTTDNHRPENVNEAVIRSLRNIIKEIPDWSKENKCVICTDDLKNKIYFLDCGHFQFDKTCLDTWKHVNPTCPICRKDLVIFCEVDLN